MAWLESAPIRVRLMAMALATAGGALLLAGVLLIVFDKARFEREMKRDLESLSDVVAHNSTAVLAFNDPASGAETLRSLAARRTIVAAALYDTKGKLLAKYLPDQRLTLPARPGSDEVAFVPGGLVVFHPVILDGERVGTVYLRSDLSELRERIRFQVLTMLAVLVVAGAAAVALSSALQRLVSRPLVDLSQTARAVSERRDYGLRAARRSGGELGQLVDAFNQMLDQIQQRDSALRAAKEDLERRVEERTQELARRNEELQQSNKELDDFAYIASHDLKEPLRGIHNFSNFLLEDYADKLDDEGRSKLETLMRLTRRMETLIDSLLHYSRLGRVDLATDQVDLNGIVAEVVDSLAITLRSEGIEVRVPRPLPTVRCDRARVGEIFANLIVNAMKYNDKAEKWIEIGVAPPGTGGAPPDGPPIFYVRDNGIGIPERHHEAVFRIFKRLHGRDKFGGGTGAGLTIVKKIVERHHGKIWLESAPGEGTTFYFTLQEEA